MSRLPDPNSKIALLKAADAVFSECGLERAKVEDITKRAGLSKGAFYLHFTSKEDAFREVAEDFLSRCGAILSHPTAVEATLSPEALLEHWRQVDLEIFEFVWKNRAITLMLQTCIGPHQYLMDTFRAGIQGICLAWIELFKGRALYRASVDSDFSSMLVCGAYHEISMHLVRAQKKPPLALWVLQAQETFVRAYGTPAFIRALPPSACPSEILLHTAETKKRAVRAGAL
jgi:AcrR family transcriptional regulator